MTEAKSTQPQLPPLDADIEERIARIDELDSTEKINLDEEVLDNRERQLLAEMKVSAGLRERCDELFSEIERARRIIAEQIDRADDAESSLTEARAELEIRMKVSRQWEANYRLMRAELQSLRERQEKAVKEVESIAKWELPPTGRYWSENNGGREMSYEAAFGSNGARDYMRQVAAKVIALLTQPEHSTDEGKEPKL